MKTKLKICSGCGEEKPIWKNFEGEKFCKSCWGFHNPKSKSDEPKPQLKKSIKQKSKKRIAEDLVYSQLRLLFLTKNPSCEARLKNCTLNATDIHHTFWGQHRGDTFLKVNTWKAVCRTCHAIIHDVLPAEEAIALGLKNNYRDGNKQA